MVKEFHPGKRQIRPVLEKEKARLGLSIVDNIIAFDILDPRLAEHGLTGMPHTVANNPQEIVLVLHGAAHSYWHLNHEINAFYIDNTDFSIETIYQSPTSGKYKTYLTLPKNGGYLTLGYGFGGVDPSTYRLEEGTDIDVGYLVFFIASESVNLSKIIPQKTPFEGPGRTSVSVSPITALSWCPSSSAIILSRGSEGSETLKPAFICCRFYWRSSDGGRHFKVYLRRNVFESENLKANVLTLMK
ncbi:uncharacterized protein LACBIDRAFT_317679 [Laccaria bicolor S238N-H82]|uniref:Predicted protein n=1 Tax=Laccaria bicolor (strain S238N-H82 / ATCC MYA-4686) TaxID=486041 RepID=B0E267_LACBS|nr:uncharacterized protein LACBIDRAFT_317679 [Laccaria bicolor S238N-H82]EDQ99073.1 predicted protein [Laccaria bicolor S238N-H82]|eukprot:XP_001890275.1 predicted protein [Laccaria bicolor S238N-H82]